MARTLHTPEAHRFQWFPMYLQSFLTDKHMRFFSSKSTLTWPIWPKRITVLHLWTIMLLKISRTPDMSTVFVTSFNGKCTPPRANDAVTLMLILLDSGVSRTPRLWRQARDALPVDVVTAPSGVIVLQPPHSVHESTLHVPGGTYMYVQSLGLIAWSKISYVQVHFDLCDLEK